MKLSDVRRNRVCEPKKVTDVACFGSSRICGGVETFISSYCEVSPRAEHHRCFVTWCVCPCHTDDGSQGMYY